MANEVRWTAQEVQNQLDKDSKTLDLSHKKVIPADIANISGLSQVVFLKLTDTTLPKGLLSLMPRIQKLILSRNRLTEVPRALLELKELSDLSLDHNEIESMPYWINQLESLKHLSVIGNKIAMFLRQLSHMPKLETLILKEDLVLHGGQLSPLSNMILEEVHELLGEMEVEQTSSKVVVGGRYAVSLRSSDLESLQQGNSVTPFIYDTKSEERLQRSVHLGVLKSSDCPNFFGESTDFNSPFLLQYHEAFLPFERAGADVKMFFSEPVDGVFAQLLSGDFDIKIYSQLLRGVEFLQKQQRTHQLLHHTSGLFFVQNGETITLKLGKYYTPNAFHGPELRGSDKANIYTLGIYLLSMLARCQINEIVVNKQESLVDLMSKDPAAAKEFIGKMLSEMGKPQFTKLLLSMIERDPDKRIELSQVIQEFEQIVAS